MKTGNDGKLLQKIKVLEICMQNPIILVCIIRKTNNKVLPNLVFTMEIIAFKTLAGVF